MGCGDLRNGTLSIMASKTRNGFVLDQRHRMSDFVIAWPNGVYVEAVVANLKQDGRKKIQEHW